MQILLSTIYKIGSIISLCVFIASCDAGDGRDLIWDTTHQLQVENTSAVALTLHGYDTEDEEYREDVDEGTLNQTLSLEANSKGPIVVNRNCSPSISHSSYFPKQAVRSLVLKLENGKG